MRTLRNKPKIKTCILILLISVISLSGCTEFDNLIGQGNGNPGSPYTVVFVVTDKETGYSQMARISLNNNIYHTSAQGKYIIRDLNEGIYQLIVDAREFSEKSYDIFNQQITLNHDIQINIELSIEKTTIETIET